MRYIINFCEYFRWKYNLCKMKNGFSWFYVEWNDFLLRNMMLFIRIYLTFLFILYYYPPSQRFPNNRTHPQQQNNLRKLAKTNPNPFKQLYFGLYYDLLLDSAGGSSYLLVQFKLHAKISSNYNIFSCLHQKMESSYCEHEQSEPQSSFSFKKSSQGSNEEKWGQGIWGDEQKVRYIAYINFNKELLNSRLLRRTSKIFKQMSQFIKTRSPSQCRSQNQKVYRRFKTTKRIISAFRQEFGGERLDSAYRELMKDPLIIFHTESDRICAINKAVEGSRVRVQMGVQTESGGIWVQMSIEQHESWRIFKSLSFNPAYVYQFNQFAHFYH